MIIRKANRISGTKPYYFATKLQQVARMNAAGADVINLGIGSPDLLPPPAVLDQLIKATTVTGAHQYQPYRGITELRSAFAGFYQQWFDISLDADTEVLPLLGSKEGIMHISMSFLQEGDIALIPNPGYPAYAMCTRLTGATTTPYELTAQNDWLPDLDQLAETVNMHRVKIMWINYPHMPTGARASKDFYAKLIRWATKHEVLICNDNPYNFILNQEYLSPLQIDGARDVCIELLSLSKCYNMAGWRVGCLVGNTDYINAVASTKSQMDSGMFKPVQKAAAVALMQGQDWFANLNDIYLRRRVLAHQILDTLGCSYDQDTAGMFVWAQLPTGTTTSSADYIDSLLQEAHVFLTPGHIFGSNGEGHIRISLCSSEDLLAEAHRRIVSSLKTKI